MPHGKRGNTDQLATGVYLESGFVTIAFRADEAHATIRVQRRHAATLTAKLALAIASIDDIELESVLRGQLSTNGDQNHGS